MKITLNQKQMDFLKSTYINTGFCAGLGSGKSYVATLKTIIKKTKFPNCTVAYYLPTYGLIRDIAFDKFPDMLSKMGYKYKLNKSDKEIHIEDYGKIIFRSMDTPENIVGYETFYTIIDECDILPMEKMNTAYKKILGRNRQVIKVEKKDIPKDWIIPMMLPKGMEWNIELKCICWCNQIDVSSTPEGFKWFYKRYVKEFNEETDLLVRASTYENKHLPKQYIYNLEQEYPPNLLKAYLNGEFVNLSNENVYSYFDRKIHHKDIELQDYEVVHCGQDFNYNGCVTTCFVVRDGIPHLFDEIISKDTYGIVENLNRRFKSNTVCVYPDASGKAHKTNSSETDLSILRKAGFSIYANNKNPMVRDRINSVNAILSHNRFFIDTNKCPKTTQALEQQAYDDKGEPEKFAGSATVDDFNDSLGYFIYYKFPLIDRGLSTSTFIV